MCSGYFFLERNFILRIILSGIDFLFLFLDFYFRNTIISFPDFFFSECIIFQFWIFLSEIEFYFWFPDFYFQNSIITSGFIFPEYIIFNSGFLFPELRVFLEIKKICWVQVKNDWVQGAFASDGSVKFENLVETIVHWASSSCTPTFFFLHPTIF